MQPEDLSTLSGRIEYVCFKKKLKQSELASLLGVSSTAIYKIASGATMNPSMDLLLGFYQKLDINLLWLATGQGDMFAHPTALSNKSADGGAFGGQVTEQMENRIQELKDQVDNLKYIVNLQRQMLEQSNGHAVSVGKLEGAIQRPLSALGSFEELMQQYKSAVLGGLPASPFFLAPANAKLVAPRSFV